MSTVSGFAVCLTGLQAWCASAQPSRPEHFSNATGGREPLQYAQSFGFWQFWYDRVIANGSWTGVKSRHEV